ncbi:hypothetical protein Dsin_021629 [Dipteronia sinensis]|uniref:Reverse transcriptase domain-containing protein n=1 Tax=Dipteronia sinensis TaxID=43782 RepID=A0AAE0A043_9ROSI|nr:hypothetical protein Dsin_021629 [Dipteronia sinensis]
MMEIVSTENELISILTSTIEKENQWNNDKKLTRWKRLARDKSEGKVVAEIAKYTRKREVLRDTVRRLTSQLEKWSRARKRACMEELCALRNELEGLYGGVMSRAVGRRIKIIEDMIDRHWREKIEDVEMVITDFYKTLFSLGRPPDDYLDRVLGDVDVKVTACMNIVLLRDFSAEEVVCALKQMDPLKAPGPDGLPTLFYHKFWDIVGSRIVKTVLDVLNNNMPMGSLWKAVVILIPKVNTLARIGEFRLISLCNVTYKLIAKVMVNRLKLILDQVITPNQSAFVLERLITDNVIVGFECLHSLRNRRDGNVGRVALKLDMSKAYDRVELGFLKGMMLNLGFDLKWIELVMKCLYSASYSFLVNGETR